MTSMQNILIIGRTGSGKSALANVIIGTNEFKESDGSISQTKEIQTKEAEIDGVECRIIDTIGIGDTEMESWEELYELAKVSNSVKDGLSQIFLVTDSSRFTKETKETYRLLEKCFFDKDVADYVTIVRTHFSNLTDKNKQKVEKQKILENNGDFEEVIEDMKFIFVDNPPTDVDSEQEKALNKEKRAKSNKILRDHLEIIFEDIDTSSEEENYRPENLNKLNLIIDSEIAKGEKLEKEKNKVELEKLKKEVVKKTLQHIVEIYPEFSKKERIQEQLRQLETLVASIERK